MAKHKSRYKGIKKVAVEESFEDMRAGYPPKLIDAFVAVVKSGWAATEYAAYCDLAKTFLGKESWKERLDQAGLISQLSSATADLLKDIDRFKGESNDTV